MANKFTVGEIYLYTSSYAAPRISDPNTMQFRVVSRRGDMLTIDFVNKNNFVELALCNKINKPFRRKAVMLGSLGDDGAEMFKLSTKISDVFVSANNRLATIDAVVVQEPELPQNALVPAEVIVDEHGEEEEGELTFEEWLADAAKVIAELIQLDGVQTEICGRWLWISGNTKPNKEKLKELDCKWCRKKGVWAWKHPKEKRTFSKGEDMETIRDKYGSKRLTY